MIPIGPIVGFGVGYHITRNPKAAAVTTGAGWLAGRFITWSMISTGAQYGGRAALWVAADVYAGVVAAASASTVVAASLAIAVPMAVGYAAATVISGETGREQLTDFLTGKVSPSQYMGALEAAHERQRNVAVEGNAGGILAGLPIYSAHLQREAEARGIPIEEYYQYGMALREFELGYTNIDPRV